MGGRRQRKEWRGRKGKVQEAEKKTPAQGGIIAVLSRRRRLEPATLVQSQSPGDN